MKHRWDVLSRTRSPFQSSMGATWVSAGASFINRSVSATGNAFAPAKLGDRGFAAKAIEHNADLLFRRMVLPSCPSDVADNAFRRHGRRLGFRLISLLGGYDEPEILPSSSC